MKTSLYNDLLLVHPGYAKLNWIKWLQGRVGEFHRHREMKGGGGGGGTPKILDCSNNIYIYIVEW